ncbi:MAG TPA: hypothetical protein VG295_01405 [Solirubrobacteraceae bacterium]|jgi:4-hydroxybenzoate polyprenyltransferase|nr:hypothetical protein [Solirubrobacteraceae bacterium]
MNARRNAMILIPVSAGIGIVAALLGNWPVFAFMVLSVAFQVTSLVMIRRRMGRRD